MSEHQHSTAAIAVPTKWFRVPDPDEDPDRPRFISWGKVPIGTELEGIWQGALEGEYGLYGVLEEASGVRQRFGLPTLLAKRLHVVDPGVAVRIVYLGTKEGKEGRSPYHCFDVYSDRPVALAGRPTVGELAAASDNEEVPF